MTPIHFFSGRAEGTRFLRLLYTALPCGALIVGCIGNKPFNPAATQPATVVDLSTTQPSTYWEQPAVASVTALQFQTVWDTSAEAARRYGFSIDRRDFRNGLLTTKSLVSKQFLEPWRRDSGSSGQVLENSMATLRRTIHFEVDHLEDGTYRVTPKVLVERLSVLERRTTSSVQYRSIFAGPVALQSRVSVTSDDPTEDIPIRYYTPLYRDKPLERQLAVTIQKLIEKAGQKGELKIIAAEKT